MQYVLIYKGKSSELFDADRPWSWAQMVKFCGHVTLGQLKPRGK